MLEKLSGKSFDPMSTLSQEVSTAYCSRRSDASLIHLQIEADNTSASNSTYNKKDRVNDDSIDSGNECYRDHCSCCESMKPKFIKHGQSLLLVFHVLAFFYGFLQFQRPSTSSDTQNNQQIILLYTIVLLGLSIAQMVASHRRDRVNCLIGSKILSYLYSPPKLFCLQKHILLKAIPLKQKLMVFCLCFH